MEGHGGGMLQEAEAVGALPLLTSNSKVSAKLLRSCSGEFTFAAASLPSAFPLCSHTTLAAFLWAFSTCSTLHIFPRVVTQTGPELSTADEVPIVTASLLHPKDAVKANKANARQILGSLRLATIQDVI